MAKVETWHNSIEAFWGVLVGALAKNPLVKRRSVLVAVASVSSMEGDVCPLVEMVRLRTRCWGTRETCSSLLTRHTVLAWWDPGVQGW